MRVTAVPATRRADLRLRAFDRALRRAGPPIETMTVPQLQSLRARRIPDHALAHAVFGRPADGVAIDEDRLDTRPWPIPLRVYRPAGAQDAPVVVFFHGGGWVIGNVAQADWLCSHLAASARVVVVSAGYRLAPEHRFPAAVDDAIAAVAWIAAHADRIGGDGSRLAVMGASAGGNLAAVVSHHARDTGGPAIAQQTLLYPAVDVRAEAAPPGTLDDAPMLRRTDRVAYLDHYTGGQADPTDPRLSPLLAPNFADLPPALIITAEHDPLRDSARRYAERLRADGTRARYTAYVGMTHGFLSLPGLASGARQALAEICQVIGEALH